MHAASTLFPTFHQRPLHLTIMLPVSIIAACSLNRVIGRQGRLPWSLPADWAFFCAATRGQVLVVGRRSFQEFDGPVPNRWTIVVTSSPLDLSRWPAVRSARSLDEALALANTLPMYAESRRVFVGGGQRLFQEALAAESVESCYVTRVHRVVDGGDAFLPNWTRRFPTLRFSSSTVSGGDTRCVEAWHVASGLDGDQLTSMMVVKKVVLPGLVQVVQYAKNFERHTQNKL